MSANYSTYKDYMFRRFAIRVQNIDILEGILSDFEKSFLII
jgi:hypothetical protein